MHVLIKLLASFSGDPQSFLKYFLIALLIPVIFLIIILSPLAIWSHVPLATDEHRENYYAVVIEIESSVGVLVDVFAMLAIHAIMYEQNFDKPKMKDIRELGWRFIHEYQVLVSATCTDEEGESYDCSYYETHYELHSLETVVNGLIADRKLKHGDLEHVERFIAFGTLSENVKLPDGHVFIQGQDGWIWPSTSTIITSHFGWRTLWGQRNFHNGLDIGGPTGTPIMAMADGTVSFAGFESCGGNTIYINHGNGVQSRYLHLHTMSVRAGTSVRAGQPIATLGNTGTCTTGPHLHWEIRINGEAVDPLRYFR